jgi:chromosome partitioning protein
MIVAFASSKGGVAKTTSCVNLAGALAQHKPKSHSVLIIDFDAQGGATHHLSSKFGGKFKSSLTDVLCGKCDPKFAIHSYKENLDLIPISYSFSEYSTKDFSKELQNLIKSIRNNYDFIFFDLSPAIFPGSTIPLSLSDTCIIPVYTKGGLSLLGLQAQGQIIVDIQKKNPSLDILGILATFVDRTKISKEVVEYLKKECSKECFTTAIRENTSISQASSLGKLIFEHAPQSNGAKDYTALAKEFLKRVQERKALLKKGEK